MPRDSPSPWLAPAVLVVAQSWSGQVEAASRTHATGQQALDHIGADDYAHVRLATADVVARIGAQEVRAFAEDALRRSRPIANPSLLIITLRWFASTRLSDEGDEAIHALDECLAHSRAVATADHPDALQALGKLGLLRVHRGEHTVALEGLREAVRGAYDTGQAAITAVLLNFGVSIAAELGEWEFAATLGAVATSPMLSFFERTDRQAELEQAQTQLGRHRYDAAIATGNDMAHGDLVEYTVGELDRLLLVENERGPGK